jgi:cysteine desulfurase
VSAPTGAVYLDHNATTPLDERVLEAMLPFLGPVYGNPSSVHSLGRQARHALESARATLAAALGAGPHEIVFTGSGSEANALALLGACPLQPPAGRTQVAVSAVEHPSVLESAAALQELGYTLVSLPVDGLGRVDLDRAEALVGPQTWLLSVQTANNEVGTLQPVAELARMAHAAGALVHTDAVQALGKLPLDVRELGVDLLTASAHKLYGPKGVGALWAGERVRLRPLVRGGPQEDRRRAGTENLAAIAGFARACELFAREPAAEQQRVRALRDELAVRLVRGVPGARLYGDRERGLGNTLSLALPGLAGDELLILLDLEGVCVSTGSACSSGSMRPSHVLLAMGLSEAEARRVVRLSLGRASGPAEIERTAAALLRLAAAPA